MPRPLDTADAHASRRLFDARLPIFLRNTLGVSDFRCGFASDTANYADAAIAELRIDTDTGPVSVFMLFDLEYYPALSVCVPPEPQTGGRCISPAELTLRNTVANLLCGPFLERLETLGLKGVQIVTVRRGPLPAPHQAGVTVSLSLTLHGQWHEALVWLPTRCIEWLDTCLSRTARPVCFDAALRIPGSLVLGTKLLSIKALSGLRSGDILLRSLEPSLDAAWLHASEAPSHPVALATWGSAGLASCQAAVTLYPRKIILLKEPLMSESTVLGTQATGLDVQAEERTVEVGALELPVQFVVDTIALTIDEVSSLAPGYAIELPTAIAELTLKLIVHGQVIGYGELVSIGEHVGIRILRMAHEHGSVQ
ncbi:hypothetical protein WT83_16490 [Burkholderia territorii]|uniref:Flagellar motor switch protein FliN-like C-terminal domain-containing protein n=1 Tax=Burkholderia territorii TaxID=1503055 RepID=A0A108ENH9_9BURK|nr:hypothetical protein WT83_16490 [Burkholderia territorii]